ncbi:13914_t:CDS:2 [Funneliformis geosporum]|nr:13914_t:CDS:2 [Funneliformis geosporum]
MIEDEWSCKNKTSTTSIANHLRTKHRIIEGRFEGAEILPDSENKIENQDPLDQKFIEVITNDLLDWLVDNMQAFHLTPNLEIRQALLTIENFKYLHLGDSIKDSMRQLETNHVHCIAHIMQLAIKDGLKEIKILIDVAKKLNSFIVNHDKYHILLKETFLKYLFLLERLIYFRDTLPELANKLTLDPNRSIRSDDDLLKNLLLSSEDWIALEELILLLRPFVNATNLTSASLNKCWKLPHMLGCIASFLDPRFKYLGFLSANQIEDTKQHLKQQIELLETSKLQSISSITSLSYNNSIFIKFFNQNMTL